MSFDNGTRSFKTMDTVRSVGSLLSANAAYSASMNVCSISLPVKPSVALASTANEQSSQKVASNSKSGNGEAKRGRISSVLKAS